VVVRHGPCDEGVGGGASKVNQICAAAVHNWLHDLDRSVGGLDSSTFLITDPACGTRRGSRPGVVAPSPSSVATPAATTAAPTQAKDGGHGAYMRINKGKETVDRECKVNGDICARLNLAWGEKMVREEFQRRGARASSRPVDGDVACFFHAASCLLTSDCGSCNTRG